jgi:ectoine hydroxylase-related dioxygenase (phytanoyl-CoA dioxygenase family)
MNDLDINKEFEHNGFILPDDHLSSVLIDNFKIEMSKIISQRKLNKKSKSRFNWHLHLPLSLEQNIFLRLANNETILKYVRAILGENILLFHSHAYIKDSESGNEVKWHQDGYYFPLSPKKAVTVWIKLDDSDPMNSCLEYYPGKTNNLYKHISDKTLVSFKYHISDGEIDDKKLVLAPRKKGQFVIHDILTPHRSRIIVDDTVRAAIIFRYIPADVFYDSEEHKTRIINEFKSNNAELTIEQINGIITGSVQITGKNLNQKNNILADISCK